MDKEALKEVIGWMESVILSCDVEIECCKRGYENEEPLEYWKGRKQLAHEIIDTLRGDL